MSDFLVQFYPWILAFHLIDVMFWMAGMYYLPRLFVYHAEAMENGQPHEVFETMEAKLLRIIMNPAMMAAWLFGILLLVRDGFWVNAGIWMHIKLGAVIFMSAYHGFLAAMRKKFVSGVPPRSSRFFRLINEIPPVLTVIIVIMVIVRPF
jgi:putative membrane protein